MKIWIRAVGVALIVLAAGLALYRVSGDAETTTDAFVTGHVHPISPRVTGTVVDVKTDDNRHVRQGEVLVLLDEADFLVRSQLATAQIAQSQAQIAVADAQMAQARAAIASAHATVQRTRLDLQRATELIGESPRGVSRQEFDAAAAAADAARAAADGAEAQLSAAGASRAAATALVATGTANLRDADLSLSYTKIVAPIDGYVGRKSVETGARVNAGQTLLTIVSDDVWVVANYKETQLRGIEPGAEVAVRVDALPGVVLHGRVDSFSPASGAQFSLLPPDNATGNFTKVVQRVPVKILLQAEELSRYRAQLLPGLSVTAKIHPGKNAG